MQIKFEDNIFFNAENLTSFRNLYYILCQNNYHDFFCELENIEDTPVFISLTDIEKEIIFGNYEKIITKASNLFDFEITNTTTDYTYDLNESIRFFKQPVSIVLENSNNDSFFLKGLFKNFKRRSKKINAHRESGDLEFVMAGGKEDIINLITGKLNEFENLPKPDHKYLRYIVIFDSDKKFPTNNTNNNLVNYLNDFNISYHELEKREIENYMPDIIFNNFNDNFSIEYLGMNPIQKDYFDLENGFPNRNRNDLEVPVQELYNTLSNENYNFFRNNEFIIEGSFKAEFPKFFLSDFVNQENLKQRVSHQENQNELEEILDKINQLL